MDGSEASDWLGFAVAGITDLDADGYPDYLVSAPYANPGATDSAGSVYVHSGATNELLFQFDGNRSFDQFGAALANAGDVNGDGIEDIIVGAPKVDSFILGLARNGSAYVFSGANGGLLYRIEGSQDSESLGAAVSGAGDVDMDGFDDFIVGAPGYNSFHGTARVHSGATGAVLFQFDGVDPAGQLGATVASPGDVNNDGHADIAVGSSTVDSSGITDSGLAAIYSGATGNLLYQYLGTNYQDWLGRSIAGAGDVNADGLLNSGKALLYSGSTGLLLQQLKGGYEYGSFGDKVSSAGDLNGDGILDLVIGGFTSDPNGLLNAGSASVYSSSGELIHHFEGDAAASWFGSSVAAIGDVNDDGFDEIVAGAYIADSGGLISAGSAYVLGLNPFMQPSARTVSASSGALLGLALDFPADAGFDEYKILMSGAGPGSFNFGVEIPLAFDESVINSFYGDYPFAFSSALHGSLNANGDGSCSIGILPGTIVVHIGRTFRLAAIANKTGLLPEFSSVAVPIEIVL